MPLFKTGTLVAMSCISAHLLSAFTASAAESNPEDFLSSLEKAFAVPSSQTGSAPALPTGTTATSSKSTPAVTATEKTTVSPINDLPDTSSEKPESDTTTKASAGSVIAAPANLGSAPECKLPQVRFVQTEEQETKTIVRWEPVDGAVWYDVFKRTKSGEFAFIERVKSPTYTAYLAKGAVKYEDFKIAAVCGESQTASTNASEATNVRTWPMQILGLVLLSLGIWTLAVRARSRLWRNT